MTSKTDRRLTAVREAVVDEQIRVNAAIKSGKVAHVQTFNGPYVLRYVDSNFDYHTDGNGGFGQTWSGCNDGEWARIMRELGLDRNRLFATFTA